MATRSADDRAVQAERDAEEALEIGDHDAARAGLQAARKIIRAKMTKTDQREEAALVAEEARVEESRLNYPEAARLFEEAASLLPVEDRAERWGYLLAAANAF